MLVRANLILLWNPFPPPPIKPLGTPSRLVHSGENSGNTHQDDEQISTPDTAQSANNDIEENSEYDIVTVQDETITSTTTINVSLEEEEGSNNRNLSQQQQPDLISLPEDNTTTSSDAIDRFSAEHDIIMHSTTHDDSSSINVNDNSSSVLTLLDKPIPTYYTTPLSSPTNADTTYDNDSKVIYYKRREDFYPQIIKHQLQQMQLSEEENLSPASNNSQQNRRSSIHNVLGKAATRIHPGPALNDNGGMPVFKPSQSAVLADKIKPKAMFKRIKKLVKNNSSKKRSTL